MTPHVGILLQARVGSTRLPAKALEPIGGRTIVEQCLRRLMRGGAGRVILATTDAAEDDTLALLASRLGAGVYRGDRNNVLQRFIAAAGLYGFDTIVRATGDNPGVDHDAPRRLLRALVDTGADYVAEQGLPCGAAVEAVTTSALRRAAALATTAFDREHVTTFIRERRDLFDVREIPAPPALRVPSLRITVDTAADLAWLRELYFRSGSDDPTLGQLIAAAVVPTREAA